MAHHIVIGDIHGCYDELRDLLEAVGPGADDQIIGIGDLVNRGPASERVLEFFRDAPNAWSITGNHERKHVRSAAGLKEPSEAELLVRRQVGDRYGAWVRFMAGFPVHAELPAAILVHAMLEPGVPLARQRDDVMVGTMSGELHMRQHHPVPWYDHYTGPRPLIVGHHDYLRDNGRPLVREGMLYGIDTGCVYGGRLTALVLPEFRLVSVAARGKYWPPVTSPPAAP